jgi:hypothetical protein
MAANPYGGPSAPRGTTALTRNYGADPFHPTVQAGLPANQNARWEWASPADYRGYAKAQQAAAAKRAAGGAVRTVLGGGSMIHRGAPKEQAGGGTSALGPTGASTVPNYQQLIFSDPIYHQATLDASAAGIQNEAQRSAQTRSELINFGDTGDISGSLSQLGLDPNSALYQNLLGDVNASQQSAANLTGAGLSQTARMAQEHATNIDTLLGDLGARGAAQSGGAGVSYGNEAQNYSQKQFDARQTVLNYLAGVQSAYATAQRGVQGTLGDAASAAAARVAGLYPVAPNYASVPAAVGGAATGAGTAPAPPAAVPYYPLGAPGTPRAAPRPAAVSPYAGQVGRNI